MTFTNSTLYLAHAVDVTGATGAYGDDVAEAFLEALSNTDFTGEVDIMAGDGFVFGLAGIYLFAVGFDNPGYKDDAFDVAYYCRDTFKEALAKRDMRPKADRSEFHDRGALAHYLEPRGRVRFKNGKPVEITEDADSFFIAAVRRAMSA